MGSAYWEGPSSLNYLRQDNLNNFTTARHRIRLPISFKVWAFSTIWIPNEPKKCNQSLLPIRQFRESAGKMAKDFDDTQKKMGLKYDNEEEATNETSALLDSVSLIRSRSAIRRCRLRIMFCLIGFLAVVFIVLRQIFHSHQSTRRWSVPTTLPHIIFFLSDDQVRTRISRKKNA